MNGFRKKSFHRNDLVAPLARNYQIKCSLTDISSAFVKNSNIWFVLVTCIYKWQYKKTAALKHYHSLWILLVKGLKMHDTRNFKVTSLSRSAGFSSTCQSYLTLSVKPLNFSNAKWWCHWQKKNACFGEIRAIIPQK